MGKKPNKSTHIFSYHLLDTKRARKIKHLLYIFCESSPYFTISNEKVYIKNNWIAKYFAKYFRSMEWQKKDAEIMDEELFELATQRNNKYCILKYLSIDNIWREKKTSEISRMKTTIEKHQLRIFLFFNKLSFAQYWWQLYYEKKNK